MYSKIHVRAQTTQNVRKLVLV